MSLYSRVVNYFSAQPEQPPAMPRANSRRASSTASSARRTSTNTPPHTPTTPTRTTHVSAPRRKRNNGRNGPRTPTTIRKIVQKAQRTRATNKWKAEQEAQKILDDYTTYWRVLRHGKGYRSYIGQSSWKKVPFDPEFPEKKRGLMEATPAGAATTRKPAPAATTPAPASRRGRRGRRS